MIDLRDIQKSYRFGDTRVPALKGVTLRVEAGEFLAVTGVSGSGKSTLMNVLGLLEGFDSGTYHCFGQDVSSIGDDDAANIRNRRIGFVFQLFNLIPRINALRNVELPMMYAGLAAPVRRERALFALDIVGLAARADHKPSQMSGGQQQRVAIARAIVNNPDIIIADEPTGSLDSENSQGIMDLFQRLNAQGKTIILVTHEEDIAAHAQRVIRMHDGFLVEDHWQ